MYNSRELSIKRQFTLIIAMILALISVVYLSIAEEIEKPSKAIEITLPK